ncbi:MAG: hypothetical protein U0271_21135 [Polyangiaceae bacterium]
MSALLRRTGRGVLGVLSVAASLAVALYARGALAEGATPQAPPSTDAAVPESALRAVLGGEVTLRLRDGSQRSGRLVAVTRDDVTLSAGASNRTVLQRVELVELRLVSPPAVSDADLSQAMGDGVRLRLRDGGEETGRLQAFTADTLTLVGRDSVVRNVPRGEVAALGHIAANRQFGLNVSFLPGLMLDADVGLFRAYLSGSVVFPAALSGRLWGFSAGMGVTLPFLASTPELKIDILAHVNLMGVASACSACDYPTAHVFGFGLAVGMHHTFESGFTMGLTVPLIGYSVTPNYHGTTNAYVGEYYLSSAVGMPLLFMGYRF